MKPVFVGIDPSYTGFAMVCTGMTGSIVEVETIATIKKEWPVRQARLDHIRAAMIRFILRNDPVLIAIEGYSYGSKHGRELAGELGGLARWTLWSQGHGFIDVPPSTLKSYVIGRGNGPKAEMLREVYRKWEYVANDDDDADAYGLCRFAIEFSSPDRWTKVFTKLAGKVEVIKPWNSTVRKKKVAGIR